MSHVPIPPETVGDPLPRISGEDHPQTRPAGIPPTTILDVVYLLLLPVTLLLCLVVGAVFFSGIIWLVSEGSAPVFEVILEAFSP